VVLTTNLTVQGAQPKQVEAKFAELGVNVALLVQVAKTIVHTCTQTMISAS